MTAEQQNQLRTYAERIERVIASLGDRDDEYTFEICKLHSVSQGIRRMVALDKGLPVTVSTISITK